jgi:pyrroline-5-carboxylate reductase
VFYLAECLAEAGVAVGLEPGLAARLARATVEGAGELMFQDAARPPATLRRNVTSPGGTTAAALAVLMAEGGLQPLMTDAVKAARLRAEQLSG